MRQGQKLPPNRISIEASIDLVIRLLSVAPAGYSYDSRSVNGMTVSQVAAENDRFTIDWDLPAWGINATVKVRWEGDGDGEYFLPKVEVSWGSTHYSPAGAVAASNLHAAVAAWACLLEAHLKSQPAIICRRNATLPHPSADVATQNDW